MKPLADGAKLTEILQFFFGRTGAAQVLVWVKPAVVKMLVTLSEALPVLVRVTVFAALVVPTGCFPKLKLAASL